MQLHQVDAELTRWFHDLPIPRTVAVAITHVSTAGGIWVASGLLLLAFGRGATRRCGGALLVGLLAQVLAVDSLLKPWVGRVRPFRALALEMRDPLLSMHSFSFPSGHTLASFMCAWILSARFPRFRAPLLVLAGLVGLSRIHLGVHYPSDVLAGALMGLLAGVMLARIFRVSAFPEAD